MFKTITTAGLALAFTATLAAAETWTLNGSNSVISFGSVKNNYNGEAHTFSDLTGTVTEDGTAKVEIGLASVQTNIDIRNERMIEHVFKKAATATLNAQVDMTAFNSLAVGESTVTEIEGDVSLLGVDAPVWMDVFVMRLDEETVMVTTNSMMFVSTEDLGVDAGIDTLQELASLDGITRTTPVTFRLMFNAGSTES
ncbi:MAG: YceI family protein [Pseudomonadota bacterium]